MVWSISGRPIYEWQLSDANGNKSVLIGEINDRELVPVERLRASGLQALRGGARGADPLPGQDRQPGVRRSGLPLGTGDRHGVAQPAGGARHGGACHQRQLLRLHGGSEGGWPRADPGSASPLQRVLARANDLSEQANDLQKGDIGSINYQLERLRLPKSAKAELDDKLTDELKAQLAASARPLNDRYQVLEKELFSLRAQADRDSITVKDMRGELVTMPMSRVLDVVWPNDMSLMARWGTGSADRKFVSDEPREANTRGRVPGHLRHRLHG